jgi:cell division protein FtsX
MLQSIERQRHLIDFTLSSLTRRKWKNFSVLFVYTLVIFLLASVMFFTSALRKEAHLALANAPEIIVQRNLSGRYAFIPVSYAKKLKDIRGDITMTLYSRQTTHLWYLRNFPGNPRR